MIVKTSGEHRDQILDMVRDSGQFDVEGFAHVQATLDAWLDDPEGSIWLTAEEAKQAVGVAYCAPEPVTSGTWNLLMLWTASGYEGRGHGRALVAAVEAELRAIDARLLIVETSQTEEFSQARAFYVKQGFDLEAEIRDYYEEGDNKLVYTKRLL